MPQMKRIMFNRCRLEVGVPDAFGRIAYLPQQGELPRHRAEAEARILIRLVPNRQTVRVYDEVERKVVWAGRLEDEEA